MNFEQNPCIEVLIGEDVDAEILENFHQDRDVFFEAEALVDCGAVAGCQTGAMMRNLCVSGYHPISKRKRKKLTSEGERADGRFGLECKSGRGERAEWYEQRLYRDGRGSEKESATVESSS